MAAGACGGALGWPLKPRQGPGAVPRGQLRDPLWHRHQQARQLVDTGENLGLVEKSGNWYSYGGAKIGQGRDKMLAHLDEHPALQLRAG